jgi:hypothetical protein
MMQTKGKTLAIIPKTTMPKEILFIEKQRFTQWWIWLILLTINGALIYGVIKQVLGGQAFGDKPAGDTELLLITGTLVIMTLLFLGMRLETKIDKAGIYVRFFPFHLKFKHYSWDSLKRCHVRQYAPLMEYGGWGLRLGLFGKGTAYNVSGNTGLQLEFTDNKKLLIGTKKPEEMTQTLLELGQLKN